MFLYYKSEMGNIYRINPDLIEVFDEYTNEGYEVFDKSAGCYVNLTINEVKTFMESECIKISADDALFETWAMEEEYYEYLEYLHRLWLLYLREV